MRKGRALICVGQAFLRPHTGRVDYVRAKRLGKRTFATFVKVCLKKFLVFTSIHYLGYRHNLKIWKTGK